MLKSECWQQKGFIWAFSLARKEALSRLWFYSSSSRRHGKLHVPSTPASCDTPELAHQSCACPVLLCGRELRWISRAVAKDWHPRLNLYQDPGYLHVWCFQTSLSPGISSLPSKNLAPLDPQNSFTLPRRSSTKLHWIFQMKFNKALPLVKGKPYIRGSTPRRRTSSPVLIHIQPKYFSLRSSHWFFP